jgi:N-acetylglucosaminyldiphosphoundecaprenol N-acetyl-beta-D-mannosaminyltransferase
MNSALAALETRSILGIDFQAATLDQAVSVCAEAAAGKETLAIGVVNAAKLIKMRSDACLRNSVLGSDLILADGMAIVWAGRLLGQRLPSRVAGIDLFESLLALAEREGRSVYFLGADEDTLQAMLAAVRERHPALRVAGARNGYFDDAQSADIAQAIDATHPDMLFLGMPTPKKEIFLEAFGAKIDLRVCHGVGGSFDILGGKTERAPQIWQDWGMEWLYRVVQEPGRMWKRYLVTNTLFILLVLRALIFGSPPMTMDARRML